MTGLDSANVGHRWEVGRWVLSGSLTAVSGTVLVTGTVLGAVAVALVAWEYNPLGHAQAAGLQLQELCLHSALASWWVFALRVHKQ